MNNYVIYDDEEIKVEINGLAHEYLQAYTLPYLILPSIFWSFIMDHTVQKIVEKKIGKLDDIMACSNKVYKISYQKSNEIDSTFSVFQSLIDTLISIEDFNSKRKQIEQEINSKMNDEKFLCEIFEEDYFGVSGYFCYNINNQIQVLYFCYW